MTIEQISIFLENRKGALSETLNILSGINLAAISLAERREHGILRIVTSETQKAIGLLEAKNMRAEKKDVIGLHLKNESGDLARAMSVLSGVQIDYIYTLDSNNKAEASVVLRVADNELAAKLLTANGYTLLKQSDIK